MATTNSSLRNVLISETSTLKGVAILKKNFIKRITEKYPQFSKGYVQMFLRKCIINNPYRAKFGQAIDLFAENNGFLISNRKYLDTFEVVSEDKEYVKARKLARQTEKNEIIENYMKGASFAI